MSNVSPFQSQGNTVFHSVTTTSSSVLVSSGSMNSDQYLVTNAGPNTAWVTLSATPNPVAVVPSSGTPTNGIPLLPNTTQTLSGPPNAYIGAIATGSATCYYTPGEGV